MDSIRFKKSNKTISAIVSKALDAMGYHIIRLNILNVEAPQKILLSILGNAVALQEFDFVISGSCVEGVAYKGDYDVLILPKGITCVEKGRYENGFTVFEADMSTSPPGYTKLSFVDTHCEFDFSINSHVGREYISSLNTSNQISYIYGNQLDLFSPILCMSELRRTDPAVSYTDILGFEVDLVHALAFSALYLFDRWANRPRYFNWPSPSVIKKITKTKAVLVPSTLKECRTANYEWRICFPYGDKKLISSMNKTQIQLYALLKVIKKDIIRKEISGLTSFMIKNIACWVCEGMPSELFSPERLLDRLKNAIHFLIECLINNFLPCYFIPERNLMSFLEKQKIQMLLFVIKPRNILAWYKRKDLFQSMELAYYYPTAAEKVINVHIASMRIQLRLQTNKEIYGMGPLEQAIELSREPEYIELISYQINIFEIKDAIKMAVDNLSRHKIILQRKRLSLKQSEAIRQVILLHAYLCSKGE